MNVAEIKNKYPNGIVFGLLPGHGGIVDGKYVTAPNKMYKHHNGIVVYEGVENRKRVNAIIEMVNQYNSFMGRENTTEKYYKLEAINLHPGNTDTPLDKRIDYVNEVFLKYKKIGKMLFLIEVHSNAGGGSGFECYTTKSKNFSDYFADTWINHMENQFPNFRNREHKEKDFFIIKNVLCFGVLQESFFHDNWYDCQMFLSAYGRSKEAIATVDTMLEIINNIYKS